MDGFRWTCEIFCTVEQFLAQLASEWHKRFKNALASGFKEVSGNYLNMSKLIDFNILKNMMSKAISHGVPGLTRNPILLYSWIMNNFKDVNFKPETGGFYEFC
jgi:hypothetical protein